MMLIKILAVDGKHSQPLAMFGAYHHMLLDSRCILYVIVKPTEK